MMNKKFIAGIKVFIVFLMIPFFLGCDPLKMYGLKTPTADKGPLFKTPLETRKEDLALLNNKLEEFKKSFSETKKSIDNRLNISISEAEDSLKKEFDEEFFNQEQSKLNERKQNLLNIKEVLNNSEEIMQMHIKLLNQIIEVLQQKQEFKEKTYSIKEFKELQSKISNLKIKITTETFKKELLYKQKKAEEEFAASLQKDLEANKKEQRVILDKIIALGKEDGEEKEVVEKDLRKQSKSLELASTLLVEKRDFAIANIERFNLDIKYKDDELRLHELQLQNLKEESLFMYNRLSIDKADIESMEDDLAKEKQKSAKTIDRLNKFKANKKNERSQFRSKLSSLDVQKKQIDKEDEVAKRLIDSNYKKVDNVIWALEKEIELLESKKELEDERLNLSSIEVNLMNVRRQLITEDYNSSDIEAWSSEFTNAIKKEETAKKAFDEKRIEISNVLTEAKLKKDNIEADLNNLKDEKDSVFQGKDKIYIEIRALLGETVRAIDRQMRAGQEIFSVNSQLIRYKESTLNEYKMILRELSNKKLVDIWRRSESAISWSSFVKAGETVENFIREFVWYIPALLNPVSFFKYISNLGMQGTIGWLIWLCCLILTVFLFKYLIRFLCVWTKKQIEDSKDRIQKTYSLLYLVLDVIKERSQLFIIWLFMLLDIVVRYKQFWGRFGRFESYVDSIPLKVVFSLFSVVFLFLLSSRFIVKFKMLNEEMGYIFIPQNFLDNYILILKSLLYSTSIFIPLYFAFSLFVGSDSKLPDVTIGIYISVLEVLCMILLVVHKSTLINLIMDKGRIFKFLKSVLSQYYYIVLSFLMILLVLSNPYVGYYDLAFLLFYAVPLTILILYGAVLAHYYLRTYSAYWFIKEEDGDVVDRFEHAKAYYGIFVILTFLLLTFLSFIVIAKIWGSNDAVALMTNLLQEKWTIIIGDNKFGFIQFFILALFIAGAFLTSTLLEKFVLSKIFDILRLDFGVRNTVSSISHYVVVYLIIIIGLNATIPGYHHFGLITTGVLLAIGLGAKDILSDFIAGFIVLIERPVEIGNFIEVNGQLGTVKKISPRTIMIKNARQRSIIIPNKELINHTIINWTYGRTNSGFEVKVSVAYDSDPKKVRDVLSDIVSRDNRILRSPAPVIRVNDFQDNGYEFLIRLFTSSRRVREEWDIASKLRENILIEFRKNEIEIPFPHRTVMFAKDSSNSFDKGPVKIKFDDK